MRPLCCLAVCLPHKLFILYAVHIVSKESKHLILSRIYSYRYRRIKSNTR
jgi:hypothetical protein